jgi:hypothetical protein
VSSFGLAGCGQAGIIGVIFGRVALSRQTYLIVSVIGWLAVAGLGYGIYKCGQFAKREFAAFRQAAAAEIASFPVDFSKTGTYRGRIDHSYAHGHRAWVYLEVNPGPAKESMIEGLRMTTDIVDDGGQVVKGREWRAQDIQQQRFRDENVLEVAYVSGEELTSGDFRINVLEPAPALAGVSQRVYAKYLLCGYEEVADAIVARMIVLGSSVMALVIAVVLVWSGVKTFRRNRLQEK